jgi:hypothetical protein
LAGSAGRRLPRPGSTEPDEGVVMLGTPGIEVIEVIEVMIS